MKPFVLSILPRRIATVDVAFGAPFDSAREQHQSAMMKEGKPHLHRFTGFVFKRWILGLVYCAARDETYHSSDAPIYRNGNHHTTLSNKL